MSIRIRSYAEADWNAVCHVHDRARPIEVSAFVPDSAVLPMSAVAEDDGFFTSQTFVAEDEKRHRVVGFVSIEPPELTWLYVDPDFHRQGVATRLVSLVLPKLGGDAYVLCARESPAALAAYRSFGFSIAAMFPGEAHGYACECVRLCLPGSRHRDRPPNPVGLALALVGFSDDSPGTATRGNDGIWRWLPTA